VGIPLPRVYAGRVVDIAIKPVRYGAPISRTLVAAAMAELGERYGGSGDDTPVEATAFDPPDGAFLVAYLDGAPVGCGGWRSHDDDGQVAEAKRMYVVPEHRRLGVAEAILRALEDSARANGRGRMVMETGMRQPEAITMYEKLGYDRIDSFGFYRDEPECVSFGRDL
jgi:GNAT superfamily N-acetyltransferase